MCDAVGITASVLDKSEGGAADGAVLLRLDACCRRGSFFSFSACPPPPPPFRSSFLECARLPFPLFRFLDLGRIASSFSSSFLFLVVVVVEIVSRPITTADSGDDDA